MFYDDSKEFRVPLEELLVIYPKERQQFFINLVENYKIFCPSTKMIYGALNYDSELKVDYFVLFEGYSKNKKVIIWDAPFIYTNRSLPAYRYAIKTNQFKEFFDNCMMHFTVMDYGNFFDFVQSKLCGNLSLNKNDSNYWKSPDNINLLIKGISECSLLYRPNGFKPKAIPANIEPNLPPTDFKPI